MSTGCSIGSQYTESLEEDVPPPPAGKKYSIIVDMDGAKGKDASKWSSRCGALIRRHIPISYDGWRNVDDFYKNNLWKALMALIEAAEESQKSEPSVNGDNGTRSLEDFEKDPIAEVFGDDKKRSYCRAISSTSNIKQVKLTHASIAIINYKENTNQQWRAKMLNTQNRMHEEMKTMSLAINDMRQCITMLVNHFGGNVTTPLAEAASNTEQNSISSIGSSDVPLNGVIGSSTRGKQPVKLLSADLTEVAKGHIGMQNICHGRKVVKGEQVVWVEEVMDPDALIFEAPQNGHYTLSELVEGGFVVWPEYRLRC